MHTTTDLAVIIPARNEAHTLAATLERVMADPVAEVIVVDGGSRDATARIARRHGATVLSSPPGRARQMNAGAQAATAGHLFFLHADSQPPAGYAGLILAALAHPGVVAGAFTLAIGAQQHRYRVIESLVAMRCRLFGLPYGDQGLFLRRATFAVTGGFPSVDFLEDLIYVRRLGQRGRLAILPQRITTSARRWQRCGTLRTTLLNQLVLLGYACGIAPDRLGRFYRRWGAVFGGQDGRRPGQ